jgi:hypothetical protein
MLRRRATGPEVQYSGDDGPILAELCYNYPPFSPSLLSPQPQPKVYCHGLSLFSHSVHSAIEKGGGGGGRDLK